MAGLCEPSTAGGTSIDDRQVLRGRLAVAAGLQLVLDALALVKTGKAGPLDGGNVNEGVFRAVIGRDKAEALRGIEPLYGSLSHRFSNRYVAPAEHAVRRVFSYRDLFGENGNGMETQCHLIVTA